MKRLQDLPIPARLTPQGKTIWVPLVRLLASRGHDEPVFSMVCEVLAGVAVRTEGIRREIVAAGIDPESTEAWREELTHLARVAGECLLTVDDLAPIMERIPDETLPDAIPAYLGVPAQSVWPTVHPLIIRAGSDSMENFQPAFGLAQAYANYLSQCLPLDGLEADEHQERLRRLREPVLRLAAKLGIEEMPFIDQAEEIKAGLFWNRLMLGRVECLLPSYEAGSAEWERLLEQQSFHHRVIRLCCQQIEREQGEDA